MRLSIIKIECHRSLFWTLAKTRRFLSCLRQKTSPDSRDESMPLQGTLTKLLCLWKLLKAWLRQTSPIDERKIR